MKLWLLEQLSKILPPGSILVEEPMSKHTTFRIGGVADILVIPTIQTLPQVIKLAKEAAIPVTVIGNGSNLLVSDKGIRGLTILLGKEAGKVRLEGNIMEVEAGCLLSKMAAEAAGAGLSGLEFASGIPGSLGGAIVMNAGAYGGEMKDVVVNATVLTPEGEILTLSKEELELSYRHSCIPEKGYVVLGATLTLEPKEEALIRAEMADYRDRRIDKQPLEYPSAGSTFKRPEGYFAGKLIEDAGLKGYTVGGAQVSKKHAGFVIHIGGATAQDMLQLIADVQEKVYQEYQVRLEPEVKMIGEF